MEIIKISIDPKFYDAALHHPDTLPECGDLAFYVKPQATEQGNPGICITFTVILPDGTEKRAQAVTTWRNFKLAYHGIENLLE